MLFRCGCLLLPLLLAICHLASQGAESFTPATPSHRLLLVAHRSPTTAIRALPLTSDDPEINALLEKARQIRAEAAALEGRSVEDVEREATEKRQQTRDQEVQRVAARLEGQRTATETKSATRTVGGGLSLTLPETPEDQVWLAKQAVERAYKDGLTRQTVRFALVPEGETLHQEDRQWPGGAAQMYRRAAGPLTRELLRVVRTDPEPLSKQPQVTSQDVWDFDGSALITSQAVNGPEHNVQALVFPNTDNKYARDIQAIDATMQSRLFLLVNPFWRDLSSWGFNLLAPKAQELAQEAIFDKGFSETFVLVQKSVRGEDCVALKAYPYDWQLYVYADSTDWPYREEIIHLGATAIEPTSSDFATLLADRPEFKLSKNMRQLQRMNNRRN